jgi:hypothetical protein
MVEIVGCLLCVTDYKMYRATGDVCGNVSTANCHCNLFSKKNTIIRIFCIFGWLAVTINPDKCSCTFIRNVFLLLKCLRIIRK